MQSFDKFKVNEIEPKFLRTQKTSTHALAAKSYDRIMIEEKIRIE